MPGRPPNKYARHRKGNTSGWVSLPNEGRRGSTPRWPLPGRTPAGWVDLWRLPQAVVWERDKSHVQVATYLAVRTAAHDALDAGVPNAALLSELRQIEDRLGLSSMALKRLQWEIAEPVKRSQSKGGVIDAADRFSHL